MPGIASTGRLDELAQMCDAPSDGYSAGAWCEAANELLAIARDLEGILRAIERNANAWHHDNDAKARALAVIALWASGEESPHPEITRA